MDKKWLRNNLANIITSTRIVGTVVMLFLPTLTMPFFIVYAYTGLTDVLDGFVARRLGIVSQFGSKLDSVSDLLFYTTMMLKILPLLIATLPRGIMLAIYIILGIRVVIYLYAWLFKHKFQSSHAYLNKATGFFLYFVPFLMRTKFFAFYAGFICAIAALAAAHEAELLKKLS